MKGDDQRELDKLKQKAERLNKPSFPFAVQRGSSEEGKGDQGDGGEKSLSSVDETVLKHETVQEVTVGRTRSTRGRRVPDCRNLLAS